MEKLNVSIIGCGAMAEMFHIPAAMNSDKINLIGIYDLDVDKIKNIAQKFSIPFYGSDYNAHLNEYQAAVVAVPNKYHASISKKLMQNKKHVLVEKPMAVSSKECADMIETSHVHDVVLTVGQIRRYYPINKFMKNIIENEIFGKIDSIDIQEGGIYGWPMSSDSFIRKDAVGGGVLLDAGVHVIDLLHWWVGDFECLEYWDDAHGGLEADCKISFTSENAPQIRVLLSRQRNLAGVIKIVFEKVTLEIKCELDNKIIITPKETNEYRISGELQQCYFKNDFAKLIVTQLNDFADSVLYKNKPYVDSVSAMKSIQTIEKCYSMKQKIRYEWEVVKC